MRVHYDPSVDAMQVWFRPGRGTHFHSVRVTDDIHLDLDSNNRLVGLELMYASDHLPVGELMSLPLPTVELTLAEAAKESGHSPATLRVLINQGRLKGHKRGRDWMVTLFDLVNYLESRDARGPKTKLPRRSRIRLKKRDAAAARR